MQDRCIVEIVLPVETDCIGIMAAEQAEGVHHRVMDAEKAVHPVPVAPGMFETMGRGLTELLYQALGDKE